MAAADPTGANAVAGSAAAGDAQLRLLVDGITDHALYLLDPSGVIASWNTGAARIEGFAAAEIVGQSFSVFHTPEDRAAGLPERALAIARRDGRCETEGWRQRKDGSRFWASVVIDAIRGEDGALLGFAKVTRDISERKKAQDALEETRAVLAQSQKMEAIGQLTGGIAHDFNNLLTVIASNADLLGQPQLGDKERRKLIEGIQRASDRGARLTQQLLAFARRQPLRPETHSIRALIGNFEVVLRRASGETTELQLDLGRDADFARIDASQFEAALLNLVVNARDAVPQGGTIRLKTRVEQIGDGAGARGVKPGEYVVVTLEDDGMGMAPETLERAFEPFFTTKETGKGSGLGLSQVYGFVVQSGGQVKLASSVGRGTTVTLYLPTDAKAQKEAAPTETQAQGNAGTVLVVEDDPDVMEAALSMLQSLGYDVMTAPDGPTALTTLRRERGIDVLFTDVVMPNGLSGVELARQARRLRPEIRILLVSGYPTAVLSAEHGLTGEFAFLSKPYRWAELAERLRASRRAV